MIEGLKPYAEYKESEVPWMGRVPKDWRVERTKWIFRSRKELNVGRRNTNVLSLTLRGVVNNDRKRAAVNADKSIGDALF